MSQPRPSHPLPISLSRHLRRGVRWQIFLSVAGLAAAVFTGCTSPGPSAPPSPAGTAATPIPLDRLRKGMTGADTLARLGEPTERRPMTSPAGTGDIWIYRLVLHSNQRQVATSTRLVPVFDGLTNSIKEVPEAVYSSETIDTVRTTQLLFFQDRLVEWNVTQDNIKRFN